MEQEQLWDYPVVLEGSPSTLASGKLQAQNSVVGDTRRFAGQRWAGNSYGLPGVLRDPLLLLPQGNFKIKTALWATLRTARSDMMEQETAMDYPVVLRDPLHLSQKLQAQNSVVGDTRRFAGQR
ncbi:hypothetical protein AVEN_255011-1 [Araneus ventricosus]|uniref:Uncharacterized protein n=1 Tax=Araneus ventricosus TaxID=182803 RepID=A0A4Y2TUV9_ARAVE|nr:hypothetical protein AVEN_255011-1 [Araneus ventricosus]